MQTLSCALALLSGVIGAGFASGREVAHFFAAHGRAAPAAVIAAGLALPLLLLRLCGQMERARARTLSALCRLRFGGRFGRLCAGLFALLSAVTGGAMLAACAELFALALPVRGAYAIGLFVSLPLGAYLARRGAAGLALPGAALCALLCVLLIRLCALPDGEASFLPAGRTLRAAFDGLCYAALSAAMLCSALPAIMPLNSRRRARAGFLFGALFTLLLALASHTLLRSRQAALAQPLPFVALSRRLGKTGYWLCAGAMYAAALSTLCAMLTGLRSALRCGPLGAALLCLLFALLGFGPLVSRGYPVLGALCAALCALLCLPMADQSDNSSVR